MNTGSVVVILADSRGRGLADHLQTQQLVAGTEIIDCSLGGATVDLLTRKLQKLCKDITSSQVIVVLYGGLCSLTTRTSKPKQTQVIYNRAGQTHLVKSQIDLLITFCRSRGYELIISTIVPCCLEDAKQSNISLKLLDPSLALPTDITTIQQVELEQDIVDINDHIISKASQQGLSYFNAHKHIQKQSRKGKRGRNHKAYDFRNRIHYNQKLSDLPFNRLSAPIKYRLAPTRDSESTQSESESSLWDFKHSKIE